MTDYSAQAVFPSVQTQVQFRPLPRTLHALRTKLGATRDGIPDWPTRFAAAAAITSVLKSRREKTA